MRILVWLFRAPVFFTLFAFALNNQQEADGALVLRPRVARADGHRRAGRLRRSAARSACWRWCRAGGGTGAWRAASQPAPTPPAPCDAARRRPTPSELRRASTRRAMDFDLPVAAARRCRWRSRSAGSASRLDLRQWKREQRDSPKAYFKGLNLLLNEQHDKAIDAFIEAVQHDPDTSELHFALGNLFRRRGEFERAVRVHQHLLNRADLPQRERERAQHALAQDFMKAGLFDRAEQAYRALEGTPFDTEARLALLTPARALARLARRGRGGAPARAGAAPARSPRASRTTGASSRSRPMRRGQADDGRRRARSARARPRRTPRGRWSSPASARARAGRHAQALQAWDDLLATAAGARSTSSPATTPRARWPPARPAARASACSRCYRARADASTCCTRSRLLDADADGRRRAPARASARAADAVRPRRRCCTTPARRWLGDTRGNGPARCRGRGRASRCSATAAPPAASRRSTTSGNARAASAGTAIRRNGSKTSDERPPFPRTH